MPKETALPSTVFTWSGRDGPGSGSWEPEETEERESFQVAKHHLDINHHVNNAQYIKMAEEYLPEGFALKEMQTEYKKAAMLHDVIVPHGSVCLNVPVHLNIQNPLNVNGRD